MFPYKLSGRGFKSLRSHIFYYSVLHKPMLPCNCSCVFVFLEASINTNFGIARDSDTQDTLLVSKMSREKY